MQLTREQRQAVEAENPTLLVSAAAGSGKTAVLVERILRLVEDGWRLDRMLIVTFTRAAAAELRGRLHQRLQEAAVHQGACFTQALEDLENTSISTIHSFCQGVLREEFQSLGLDPRQRVAGADEQALWKAQAAREALNRLLEEGEPRVRQLVEDFGPDEVLEMTVALQEKLLSLSHPFRWLEAQIARAEAPDTDSHPWLQALWKHARRAMEDAAWALEAYRTVCGEPGHCPQDLKTLEQDREALAPFLAALAAGDVPGAVDLLPESLPRAVAARGLGPEAKDLHENRWKPARNALSDALDALRKALAFHTMDPEQRRRDLRRVTEALRGLQQTARAAHEGYLALKRERGCIDFTDMEQFTCDLLTDPDRPEIREKYRAAYDHIFIDECQDNSQIQNDILMALHGPGNHLFMVGDVKQSIYRFRMANPTLFLDRVRSYSRDEEAPERAIFLQRNFRSLPAVLDAANAVFRQVMTREETELDYLPEDELFPGRPEADRIPVELHILPAAKVEDQVRLQALAAAARIKALVDTPRPRGGVYRFRDVCILLHKASTHGKQVADILQEEGVPVFFDDKTYYATPEIRRLLALLRAVCDPLDELSLLEILRHQPFRLTDAELAEIRCCLPQRGKRFLQALMACGEGEGDLAEKCRRVQETLRAWRFRRETMRLFDFLWWILRESGLYTAMGTRRDARQRQANLRLFCQRAADFEEAGGTSLQEFLDTVSDQMSVGDTNSARPLGENEDLVRIMTMHKSKGLQFPITLCLRLEDPLGRTRGGKEGKLHFHRDLGISLPCQNRQAGTKRPSLGDLAIGKEQALDERAESCRLLYVAMTRAEDRLILLGSPADAARPLWDEKPSAMRVRRAQSMLDWVVPTALDLQGQPDDPFLLCLHADPMAEFLSSDQGKALPAADLPEDAAPGGLLPWWDGEARDPRPLKTSVSSITRKRVLADPLPLTDAEEDMEEKRQSEVIVSPLRLSEIPALPGFLRETKSGAADRGTATHRFLSLLPLERLRDVPPDQLDNALAALTEEMRAAGILTPGETGMIHRRGCGDFLRSPLGQRLLHSGRVRREWRFNLRPGAGETLLQGVIDAAFREEDGWVLIDYKTDRFEDGKAFVDRHREQLNWYAEAVRRITGEPVQALFLYALRYGKAYPVEIVPPGWGE